VRIALPHQIDADILADHVPGAMIGRCGGETMGTTWSVQFAARTHINPHKVHLLVERRLADLVAQMSHWEPESALSRFNAAPGDTWIALPRDFAIVIAQGLVIAAQSGGAFDPAIGHLVDLWGFGPAGVRPAPNREQIAQAQERSGWQRLAYDEAARALLQPGGLALDFSGIAKGYAVDTVADLLGQHGLRHTLVEIGGELVGRGMRPDGDPWWVDLEVPPGSGVAPLRVALHGMAVATSGSYRRGDHSIDARTGWPVRNGVLSLSVIGRSALEADAWATALTVLGPEEGYQRAKELGIAARFVVSHSPDRAEGHTDTERITPALASMF
jgi:thiamine biosynthesis lipoprotein